MAVANNYINNKNFLEALIKYKKECIEKMRKDAETDQIAMDAYKNVMQNASIKDNAHLVMNKSLVIFNNALKILPDMEDLNKIYNDAHAVNDLYSTYLRNRSIYNKSYIVFATSITAKPNTKTYEYIGECFVEIATRLMNRPNFMSYSWKNDMSGDGIMDCIQRMDNFNPEIWTNPFAYFSQLCFHGAVRRIKSEHKQRDIKIAMIKNSSILNDSNDINNDEDGDMAQAKNHLNSMLSCLEPTERKPLEKKFKRTTKAHQKKLKEIDEKVQIVEKEFVEAKTSRFDSFYEIEQDDEPMEELN
jgi:hypothetical protein